MKHQKPIPTTNPDSLRPTAETFPSLRYGMFVTYGLHSLLARGEWVMNRERLEPYSLRALASRFTAEHFDASTICDLAVRAGMRYIVLTSMHHEGFRLYHSELSDFTSCKSPCGRDLVAETIAAARTRGLAVGIYHSLNNWFDRPDAVDALEDKDIHAQFIANTHARFEELVGNYDFDIMWYDGWWPFDAAGWQAEALDAKLRAIRPHLIFNPRNGLPGDFATPEGHLSAPNPWRPWEACMTLNDNWGFHAGDTNWKSPKEIVKLLGKAAAGRGNLLLNIGPRGDGSLPEASVEVLAKVGEWISRCGVCLRDTDVFSFGLMKRGVHRGDWCHHGPMTASGNNLYIISISWPGTEWALAGLQVRVEAVELLPGETSVPFHQEGEILRMSGLPALPPDPLASVFRIRCDGPPRIYNHGGMRTPSVPHPPYDPVQSDILL